MGERRRLTSFSHGAGCGCKLGPGELQSVLGTLVLPELTDEVLVAADTGDDAAVVRLPDGHALIATLDFFTPIVDDPYDWGRIAATNALSDVYAMGGLPFLALNIVAWPVDDLPLEMMARVLQGGIDVAGAAGAAVLGGHSITDPEPKYGMVALGLTDPDAIVRNSTAVPGSRLFLTKPLGLGVLSTAIKRGIADAASVARAVEVMTTSNAEAAAAMREAGAESATDVTGFGLLGHLHRMLVGSAASAVVDASAVPLLEGALGLARAGVVPGGTRRNHAFVRPHTDWGDLTEPEQVILADAQTSGGLLIAASDGDRLVVELARRDVPFAEIGRIEEGSPGAIRIAGRLAS
ncbi:MAG TPA: selenide, water dikinase SelD [Actinomycetota bacterium]|jgi:selenide,water dikinase|nr:selenide, water dikinase SelD [Actinomycetota bacterium]